MPDGEVAAAVEDGAAVEVGSDDGGEDDEGEAVAVSVVLDVGDEVVAVSVDVGEAVSAHALTGRNATANISPPATISRRRRTLEVSHISAPHTRGAEPRPPPGRPAHTNERAAYSAPSRPSHRAQHFTGQDQTRILPHGRPCHCEQPSAAARLAQFKPLKRHERFMKCDPHRDR